ncbi:hypothetical protein [Citrobacter portucalensis]|uniref:hypothetical protein n=1 Tax=Citrobacter portucalensis TaxID=1639133 RepID=UPI00226B938C|nr:hypothetical protein [Citrobacter portucalensis]MCX9047064.1 hypothetical protein [Citrobacter portucalensis]
MTTETNTPDTTTNDTPASQQFLEAILYKDVVTLRTFGIDDKVTASIDLKTQIDVAQKLLASENAIRRAQSKRILAAQAGLKTNLTKSVTPPAAAATTVTERPKFFTSVKDAAASIKAAA